MKRFQVVEVNASTYRVQDTKTGRKTTEFYWSRDTATAAAERLEQGE